MTKRRLSSSIPELIAGVSPDLGVAAVNCPQRNTETRSERRAKSSAQRDIAKCRTESGAQRDSNSHPQRYIHAYISFVLVVFAQCPLLKDDRFAYAASRGVQHTLKQRRSYARPADIGLNGGRH